MSAASMATHGRPNGYQPGDVVHNADDPEDARVWMFGGRGVGGPDDRPWAGREPGGAFRWFSRDELPVNLKPVAMAAHTPRDR